MAVDESVMQLQHLDIRRIKVMKIGAMTTCFRKPLQESLRICSDLGVDGVQIWATGSTAYNPDHEIGELDPSFFSESVRQDLLTRLSSLNLTISALCGDLGRGFTRADRVEQDIEKTKRMMDMTQALGASVLTTHIGTVPEDPSDPKYLTMQQSLDELGAYGDKIGVFLATETGPESGADLAAFLKTLKSQSVKANYDPANLAMMGFDPLQGVIDLKGFIVHTHAKDGIPPKDGENFKEVPLGQGAVSWPDYLRRLKDTGFDGFLTIEREVGENPGKDIIEAASFLRAQLAAL
jgi:L-ribulose-5-phosphate 3-epimerase